MLCDELKVYVPQDGPYGLEPEEGGKLVEEETCYLKSEVDAAIAELKKKLMPCLNGDCILTCEVVEKYGKENAELKRKLEDVQATAYAEMVDANMEIRRLNHKYWDDKADEAAKMKRLIQNGEIIYLDEYCNEKDWRIMHKVWEDEETKCRAKAEEFK